MMSLGKGLKRDGYFLGRPDLAVEGGSDGLANSWEVGVNGVAAPSVRPCPSPGAAAPS